MSTKSKIDEKDIVQEPLKVDEVSTADARTVEVLSAQDSQVLDLVRETPKTFDDSAALASLKERRMPNILDLPEECKPLYKVKYRYRWLAKDKNLESKLRSSIWVLCTRNNSPYIKRHRFKTHGAIEQGGMLLAFCSEETGKIREAAPALKSAELVKHYTEDLAKQGDPKRGGFYAPDPDEGESDDGIVMD